jgi:hypothetical protein
MNFRTTYILFGTLVVMAVVFLIFLGVATFTKEETGWVLPSLHVKDNPVEEADIDTVVVERPPAPKMVFKREPNTGLWRMEEPLPLPPSRVSSSKVSDLVRDVMKADREKLSDVSGDLAQWDLNPPRSTVTLKRGDKSWQLFLGKTHETKGGQTSVIYVSSSDRKEPMAVRLNKLSSVNNTPYQFRAQETVVGNVGDVQSVELNDGGTHPNVILARKRAGEWEFKQPQNWGAAAWESETPTQPDAPKAITGVKALLDILAGLRVEVKDGTNHDFVNEDGRDLERFELVSVKVKVGDKEVTKSPLKIIVERTIPGGAGKESAKVTQTLVIGKAVEGADKKVYAMLEDEKHVFKIPGADVPLLEKVLENPATLRNRDLLAVQENNVDVIKIVAPGTGVDLKLTRSGPPDPGGIGGLGGGGAGWQMWRAGKPVATADGQAVKALLDALTKKRTIKDFREGDDKALGFDTPQATVWLWDKGIKKSEPDKEPELTSEKGDVQFVFGKSEGGFVNVKRTAEGATTVVTVPDELLKTVTKDTLTYVDKKLASFGEDAKVTELVLERGAEKFKVEWDKTKSLWRIVEPASLKDKQANDNTVDGIIEMLRSPRLRVDRIVSDNGSGGPDQVGFKVVVTTTVKDEKKEWTFLFGKDTGDTVRGKFGDVVFEVNKFFLEPLKGEFRDTTLFTFKKDKVEAMKLTDWSGVFGEVKTVELERKKGGEWAVKSATVAVETPEKKLDPKQCEDLLGEVLRARVQKFLPPGGAPKPEQMDVNKGALKIELTVAGEKEKETHWLLIGSASTDPPGFYAESSTLPKEAFIVGRTTDVFTRIREKAPLVYFAGDK